MDSGIGDRRTCATPYYQWRCEHKLKSTGVSGDPGTIPHSTFIPLLLLILGHSSVGRALTQTFYRKQLYVFGKSCHRGGEGGGGGGAGGGDELSIC